MSAQESWGGMRRVGLCSSEHPSGLHCTRPRGHCPSCEPHAVALDAATETRGPSVSMRSSMSISLTWRDPGAEHNHLNVDVTITIGGTE